MDLKLEQTVPYPWMKTDGGRSQSRRKAQRNDCTVRALAIARGLDYDTAFELLQVAGRGRDHKFGMPNWLNEQPWAIRHYFPGLPGRRRMTPEAFVKMYPEGIFICQVTHHVFTVIDGVIFDESYNRPDRCMYAAWAIQREADKV